MKPESWFAGSMASSPHPIRLRLQRFDYGFGILGSDPQQGTRRTLRGIPPMLPVLEGGDAHTDQEGEFRLRLAEALADCLDIVRRELGDSDSVSSHRAGWLRLVECW